MKGIPIRAWAYLALIVGAAIAFTSAAGLRWGIPAGETVLGFGLLFVLAELAPIRVRHGTYSVSYVLVITSIIALGPAGAATAAAFSALDRNLRTRPDWLARVLFNAAQFCLSTAVAGAAYLGLRGPEGALSAVDFPWLVIPLIGAWVAFQVSNILLVSVMAHLVSGASIGEVWNGTLGSVLGSTLPFGALGVLFAALYQQMGFVAVLFVLVPIVVSRRALQAAAEMDSAYDATVRALVTAIEAKDSYTRGHAERVSRLAVMVARELDVSEREIHMLRHAALMHDVGKLVVSHAVLTKPGKLTNDEFEHMKAHPAFGVEVISEIDWLRTGEAINAVRHHHERLDGRGYPDALAGDDIPLTARIVMVADAFDSMTSTRSYRPAMLVEKAMTELRRCAATQFDPMCIAALDRAIARNGWEPSPEAFVGEQVARTAEIRVAN